MPSTYPTELKVKTIRRYEKGESIKALSQELHISQSTLYQWRKEYCSIEMPDRSYTPAEFSAMNRKLKKLEHYMELSSDPAIFPVFRCRKNSLPWKNCTVSQVIHTVSTSYVKPWVLPGGLSTITYSAVLIGANGRKSKQS